MISSLQVQPAAAASQATQPVTESQASAATVPPWVQLIVLHVL